MTAITATSPSITSKLCSSKSVKKEEKDKEIGRGEDTGGLRATLPSIISSAQTLEEQEKEKPKAHTNCFHRMILCFLPRFLKQSTEHKRILNCTAARPGIPPILFLTLYGQKSFSFLPVSPILPLAWSADRRGGGSERKREAGGGGTRQDRAFSLEIITFTLLMYGQTTKDIHRQWEREWLCVLNRNF